MSRVIFVSDLHLGHKTILKHTANTPGAYRGRGQTPREHDQWVISQLMSMGSTKRTIWWMLGDVAMDKDRLELLDAIPGRKFLVLGNHDTFRASTYLRHFEDIYGIKKKYGMWITHAPLHPLELRGYPNLHGHSHRNDLKGDGRYYNACIEWLPNNRPITLDELRDGWLREAQVPKQIKEQKDG